ncbi:hypothetical protein [Sphingomicrobium aestuariivivum]|uniref:hypothetical protein n=1 Tax=Sphingomicrobium aestuariivivum TaxID=1582356 RepID=UPI001FD6D916|nr:hypothetical protein [Sphingomicrobium aestuariivivum]MCJ8190245.1 hypothetical protein [Sphingomicrobium aestuariivivum]
MFLAAHSLLRRLRSRISEGEHAMTTRGFGALFLFEFLVVLLGVLAAQGLAGWASERDRQEEMTASLAYYEGELADVHAGALMWQSALPCMTARVGTILERAAEERPLDPGMVEPLRLSRAWVAPVSQDMLGRFEREQGAMRTSAQAVIAEYGNRNADNAKEAQRLWSQLRRASSVYGEPGPADYAAVRETGSQLLAILDEIAIGSNGLVEVAEAIGVEPSDYALGDRANRPVRDCAELWAQGSMIIPEEGGHG